MNAKISTAALAIAAGLSFGGAVIVAAPVFAAMTVMVGGAPMYPSKNIVENAVNSKDHTTLVAAAKAAGPGQKLHGCGPFNAVAAHHEAFRTLARGRGDTRLKPPQQAPPT